jgi:hypothetical protein
MEKLIDLVVVGLALFGASVAFSRFTSWMEARAFFKPYTHVDEIVESLKDTEKSKLILNESIKYKDCDDGTRFFIWL